MPGIDSMPHHISEETPRGPLLPGESLMQVTNYDSVVNQINGLRKEADDLSAHTVGVVTQEIKERLTILTKLTGVQYKLESSEQGTTLEVEAPTLPVPAAPAPAPKLEVKPEVKEPVEPTAQWGYDAKGKPYTSANAAEIGRRTKARWKKIKAKNRKASHL